MYICEILESRKKANILHEFNFVFSTKLLHLEINRLKLIHNYWKIRNQTNIRTYQEEKIEQEV